MKNLLPIVLCALPSSFSSLPAAEPQVLVLLWFDTEDYILPASDDAAKRVAEILTARGVRGTFKVVGEKARALEKRDRKDVIEALKKHDIGYHTDFHSVHPTPAEYIAVCGWPEGVTEFMRRERNGANDVKRIFGVQTLSCYGQPGSSFAPQTFGALFSLGITTGKASCYVDEGSHVGLGGKPFWFCRTLTVYDMGSNSTRMDLHGEGGLEKGCQAFREIHGRLLKEGGGLVSIYYHPCEWVHREFWDGVNFRRGANPPREEWKEPPRRPLEETEAAFRRFEKYIDYQKSLPGVRFVTASDLPEIYVDRVRRDGVPFEAARKMAGEIAGAGKIDYLEIEKNMILSPAEQLVALVQILAGAIEGTAVNDPLYVDMLLGPWEPPPVTEVDEIPWHEFRAALLDLKDEFRERRKIHSTIFAGSRKIAPADFMLACARLASEALPKASGEKPNFPVKVKIPRGTPILTERHVAEDTPDLFGGWVIHPEGFRAPRIVQMTRLQAWTLKPATLSP